MARVSIGLPPELARDLLAGSQDEVPARVRDVSHQGSAELTPQDPNLTTAPENVDRSEEIIWFAAETTETLAADLAGRCVALARDLGLDFAGVDLKFTPDGQAFCFEVNPSPAFTYFETHTGQPIAEDVARHLLAGQRSVADRDNVATARDGGNPFAIGP